MLRRRIAAHHKLQVAIRVYAMANSRNSFSIRDNHNAKKTVPAAEIEISGPPMRRCLPCGRIAPTTR
jgi:hypothetical protein